MRWIGLACVGVAVLGGCAPKADYDQLRSEYDALYNEVKGSGGLDEQLTDLEARVKALEQYPGVVNQLYLSNILSKKAGLTTLSSSSGMDQLAEGTISLIDCSAMGCPTTAGSPLPPAGTDVGKVSTDLDSSSGDDVWTEDWYITTNFFQYSPTRNNWKGTYLHSFSATQLTGPPSGTTKHGQQVFSYASVPDPSGYSATPSTVPRYLYEIKNVNNGNASGVRGELYREVITTNGQTTWVDHWVLYDSYVTPAAGVNAKIVNRSVPSGNGLPDFLSKYYNNPNSICGTGGCTYAMISYTWQ